MPSIHGVHFRSLLAATLDHHGLIFEREYIGQHRTWACCKREGVGALYRPHSRSTTAGVCFQATYHVYSQDS